jgi:hypothetical protein
MSLLQISTFKMTLLVYLSDTDNTDDMTEFDSLKNIIRSEIADNQGLLRRLENALTWFDLDSSLRQTYEADIPYRCHVIQHLEFVLDRCEEWKLTKPAPPVVEHHELLRDLDDGLEWLEDMLKAEMERGVTEEEQLRYDFIRRSSRHWRLTHYRHTRNSNPNSS